jgi:eukaryotic-like serine/threonine-protein kinase
MSESKFQRFGKYLILDHLVDGGMAKICRARYLGEQANKVVAIKMVQPQFSNDDAFARMFQDELNITFGMLHPNIMQVYDYGKTNGQLYTAMEYIHGANLKQYLDRLREKKVVFPVEISCYIISQVCLGLHYAHTFTDKLTGKPYNIIHRDISPHNIMLTYDGAVKVIDFGIAKANTNSENTQAGTIKGKLSYLAPEYLEGLELDARYDQFAVGITLWEMLCSRKLFQANNDLAVLKQIQACKVTAPSQINPSVPKELDNIVMKALSKDRSNRYENLDQLNRALIKFLYSSYPEFNASDLKVFADDLFKVEIAKDREKFVDYGKIDILPFIEDLKQEESRTGKISKKEAGLPNERKKVREIDLKVESTNMLEIDKPQDKTSHTKRLGKTVLQESRVNAKNGRTTISHMGGTAHTRKSDPNKSNSRINIKNQTEQEESSEQASSSRQLIIILVAASLAAFAYFQPSLTESLTGINLKKLIHGPERGLASPGPSPVERKSEIQKTNGHSGKNETETEGRLILSGLDTNMEVYLDGARVHYVSALNIPFGQEMTVMVKKRGYLPFIKKISLNKGENSTVVRIPELEKSSMGLLTSSLNYTAGSKLIYEEAGELVERELPFKDLQIPAGIYQAKVVNPILQTEKTVKFKIEENKKHFLE